MRKLGIFLLGAMLLLPAQVLAQAESEARDVVLVLDNSGSMRSNDPARLSVSAVTDFIRAQDSDTRVGIVIFDSNPRLVQPLTAVSFDNRDQLLSRLDALDFSGQWTDTASAIERALYELRLNGRSNADQAIILMTDGIIDTGNASRDSEKAAWLRQDLAADASDEGVRIFAIAFTENADFQLMQSVAQATDAEYFRAIRAEDISPVLRRIDTVLARTPQQSGRQSAADTPRPEAGRDFVAVEPQQPDRIVYQAPAQPAAATTSSDEKTAGDEAAASRRTAADQDTAAASEDEEAGGWRIILMVIALLVLGAVAISIFWGENLLKLLRRPSFRKEEADHGPSAVLYDVYDPSDIKRYELGMKPAVIGRVSGSDPSMDYIVVDERTVGRWHATIERRGQSFWIRDEGSVNGTFVNDQRVTAEHPLKHGDLVRVHRHEFEFVIPELFDSDRTMISPEAKMKKPDEEPEAG